MSYSPAMLGKNLIKLIRAIDLLAASGGTTVGVLCSELELSSRSVFRMIKTMREELDFPTRTTARSSAARPAIGLWIAS